MSLSNVEFSLVNVVTSDTCMLMAHNSVVFKTEEIEKRGEGKRYRDRSRNDVNGGIFFALCDLGANKTHNSRPFN